MAEKSTLNRKRFGVLLEGIRLAVYRAEVGWDTHETAFAQIKDAVKELRGFENVTSAGKRRRSGKF